MFLRKRRICPKAAVVLLLPFIAGCYWLPHQTILLAFVQVYELAFVEYDYGIFSTNLPTANGKLGYNNLDMVVSISITIFGLDVT